MPRQKELRRALCLQADNGSCLAYALHSWQSHEAEVRTNKSEIHFLAKMSIATATLAICKPPKLILRIGEPQPQNRLRLACELFLWLCHKTGSKPDSQPKKKGHNECVPFSLAENQRFELWNRVTGYTISNRAPSTN